MNKKVLHVAAAVAIGMALYGVGSFFASKAYAAYLAKKAGV